jgi:Uncharacterized protein related to plant photosystem II stability/assembly factor
MRNGVWIIGLALAACGAAHAQWQMQDSPTTADLRGIHNVGGGVAWASGTNGTVLHTEDGGSTWLTCAVPPGAEHLDFRGVQAFDAKTAIVMSSGKGDSSRLYKTTDGCQTWKLVFTNPDKDGFWDAIVVHQGVGLVIGDPVNGRYAIFASSDGQLNSWSRFGESSDVRHFRYEPSPYEGEQLFAASNSIAKGSPAKGVLLVTGGPMGAMYAFGGWQEVGASEYASVIFAKTAIPLAKGESAGAFSFDCADRSRSQPKSACVAVGGNYKLPDSALGVAAHAVDPPMKKWIASKTQPHGYRSAVAFDDALKIWITVGPNGTDVSTDDGKNWRAVHPDSALHEAPDADRNWNALSLPYVVGPKGRIGKLDRTHF